MTELRDMTWQELGAKYSDHPISEEMYKLMTSLSRDLRESAIFVDVGTRDGGSALCALHAIKESEKRDRWLFSIDPYGEKPWRETGHTVTTIKYPDGHYRTAMRALSEYADEHRLNHAHFRMRSQDFIKTFSEIQFWHRGEMVVEEFGYVLLDGEHSADTVLEEMRYFAPRMAPSGVIVVDDPWLLETGPVRDELEGMLGDKVLFRDNERIIWQA